MRWTIHQLAYIALAFSMLVGITGAAAADDVRPQIAFAESLTPFGATERLDRAQLDAISGLGADSQAEPSVTDSNDISVILFDELGRPKGNGISAGTGGNSTVTQSINVGVGR